MNLPNKLTFFRILLIPFVMYLIMAGNIKGNMYIALLLFALACLTDFFDGYIARKYNLITNLGKFMDPVADKLLVICTLICFVQLGSENALFSHVWWVLALIVARELAITAFRILAVERGIVIAANIYGKLKTNFQMFWIIFLILYKPFANMFSINTVFMNIYEVLTWILMIGTAALTLVSFIIYVVQNKEVLKDK